MRPKRQRVPKLTPMIGGFLILAGVTLMGIAALTFFGYLNVGMLLEDKYLFIVALALVAVGLLDTFAAVVVARW